MFRAKRWGRQRNRGRSLDTQYKNLLHQNNSLGNEKQRGSSVEEDQWGHVPLFFLFVALNGQLVTTPIRFASSSAFWPFFDELIIYLFY